MKKQDVLIFIVALIMMFSFSALSHGQTMLEEYNLSEYTSKYGNILPIGVNNEGKAFAPAVQEGNLRVVKYLVETYPWLNLLNTPIENEDGEKEQPICIAAGKGYTKLVTYMVDKDPNLVNKDCQDDEMQKDYKAIGKALNHGFADTALELLKLNSPVTTEWR